MPPRIRLEGVTKSFGSVRALTGVDFELRPNEIVGLIGDNGAGKSTLIKVLAGVHPLDGGSFRIDGKEMDRHRYSVRAARAHGIETVFQDRSFGDKQPIWRNFFMGRHMTRFGMLRVGEEKRITNRILKEVIGLSGAGLDPDAPVSVLSGGERQGLAIGRAMYFDAQIVILDEPTTALAVKEVEKVLQFIRSIRENGRSGIFVSHNLHHLYEVADRFVFLHQGKHMETMTRSETDVKGLTETLIRHSGSPS